MFPSAFNFLFGRVLGSCNEGKKNHLLQLFSWLLSFGCHSSVSFHYNFCPTAFSVIFKFEKPCQTFFLSDWNLASTGMFQSLAYLDSDVIDNSEKKKCKSDLKLNHTQGQLKCFFKLSSCCTGWCWKTVQSDYCFTSIIDGRTDEGGLPCGSDSKESACNEGDPGLIPGLGRSPGEGNGNSLQYSGLEDPMDGGAWWATLHGVSKSRVWLRD